MEFLTMLKQTGIFLLAGQIILQFRPGQQYEKYVRLLLGLMVLAQLAVPILSLGDPEKMENFVRLVGNYEEELMAGEELLALEAADLGEDSDAFVMEGVRRTVEERLAEEFGQRDLVLEEVDMEGECLRLWISKGGNGGLVEAVEPVESVRVGKSEAETVGREIPTGRDAQLEALFAPKLGMNAENLEVRWLD